MEEVTGLMAEEEGPEELVEDTSEQSELTNTEREPWEGRERWKSRWRRVRNGWLLRESVAIIKIAAPMVATNFFYQVMFTIALVFVGNVSGRSLELDAAALALSFMNVTGVSVGIGLSSAAETLCAQMYGFKNYKGLGVVTQRGIWILGLAMFPVLIVWLNTESLLLFIQQDPCVSRVTAWYVQVYAGALPPFFLYIMLQRYLVAQSIVLLFILVGVVNNIVNIVLHAVLLYWAEIGIRGSALSLVIATLTSPCLVLFYIRFKKLPHQTWGGWSLDGLRKWGQFLRLGIPGLLMICFEWWCFEIAAFVTGSIDKTQLAIHTIVMQIISLNFMLPYGISMGLTVRVGNELGAGNPQKAKQATYAAFFITVLQSIIVALLLTALRTVLGRIFTTDRDVIGGVAEVMFVLIPLVFSDSLQGMLQGLLRGAGKQTTGAIINLISYYLIGLPLGTVLAIWVRMGTLGMWIGLLIASVIQAISYLVLVITMNWEKESLKAIQRSKKGSPSDAAPETVLDTASNGFTEHGNGGGGGESEMKGGGVELLVFKDLSIETAKSSAISESMIEGVPLISSADEEEDEEKSKDEKTLAGHNEESNSRTVGTNTERIQSWLVNFSETKLLIFSRLALLLISVVLLVLGGIASRYQPHRPLSDYCDCLNEPLNSSNEWVCENETTIGSGALQEFSLSPTVIYPTTTTLVHSSSGIYLIPSPLPTHLTPKPPSQSSGIYLTPNTPTHSSGIYLTPTPQS